MSDSTKMQAFIGTKIVLASPMSERAFRQLKGESWGGEEDRHGYLVQYVGKDNYQSWSPKLVFEESYRQVSSEEVRIINL